MTEYKDKMCRHCIYGDKTALEQQPNRCDSCTHSEEQDGSNCYECVKGIVDNFEEECKDCDFYCDGDCLCPSMDKWYACPIESSKPENQQALREYAEQTNKMRGMTCKEMNEWVYERV